MAAITDTVIAINENQFVFRGKVRFKDTGFHVMSLKSSRT